MRRAALVFKYPFLACLFCSVFNFGSPLSHRSIQMLRCILLPLALGATFVAGHDGHDDESSAIVYTEAMVMNGVTTTMLMTATASGDSSTADAAASSTTASPGIAYPTGVPAQFGIAGIVVAALAGIEL